MGREHYIGRGWADGPGFTVEVYNLNELKEESKASSLRPPGETETQQGKQLQV